MPRLAVLITRNVIKSTRVIVYTADAEAAETVAFAVPSASSDAIWSLDEGS